MMHVEWQAAVRRAYAQVLTHQRFAVRARRDQIHLIGSGGIMPDDKVSNLSFGIAAILAAHGAAAALGLVKGPVWPNFLAAGVVTAFAIFGRR